MKVEAPSFDDCLDSKEYLDWESGMDHYFGWYEISEAKRVRFARMKLVRQARLYWKSVEHLLNQRRQDLIEIWDEIKEKLREKYLPTSYQQRLLDQWQRLTQGNRSVTEYITRFDEYLEM